jgi:hypothetical protein
VASQRQTGHNSIPQAFQPRNHHREKKDAKTAMHIRWEDVQAIAGNQMSEQPDFGSGRYRVEVFPVRNNSPR